MVKVIATDLDGTLFYPKKFINMIPKKSLQLLRSFIDNGGEVLLVTGRSFNYTKKVEKKVGRKLDVVAMNGSLVSVDGQIIKEEFLSPKIIDVLKDINEEMPYIGLSTFGKKHPLVLSGNGERGKLFKFGYTVLYSTQGVYVEDYIYSNSILQEELKSNQVYKLMLYFGLGKKGKEKAKKAVKFIKEKYGDSFEASWASGFIEVTNKGCMKANGIRKYLQAKGYKDEEIVVIGDGGNDIPMFEEFYEQSCCMSHSSPQIQKHAKHVIKRFHDIENYL